MSDPAAKASRHRRRGQQTRAGALEVLFLKTCSAAGSIAPAPDALNIIVEIASPAPATPANAASTDARAGIVRAYHGRWHKVESDTSSYS